MIDLKEKCTECSHRAICKNREMYNLCYDKISNRINDLEEQFGDICVVEVTCKHFDYLHTPHRKVFN